MKLPPEALNPEGYIIDQSRLKDIPFGYATSDRNGCGWIAVYNFLRALGRTEEPETLAREMEKTLLGDFLAGVHPLGILWALGRNRRIPLDWAVRPFHAQLLCEKAPAGIVWYFAGATNHYAAFRREADGKLRFFGAIYGKRDHVCSLAEFFSDCSKGPLTLVLTARLVRPKRTEFK